LTAEERSRIGLGAAEEPFPQSAKVRLKSRYQKGLGAAEEPLPERLRCG